MRLLRTPVNTGLLAVLLAAAVSGCPRDNRPAVPASDRAGLEEKARRLDVEYQLLQKDHPPQAETQVFRRNVGDLHEALNNGNLADADRQAAKAQDWMDNARPRYYARHKSEVIAGTAPEKAEELMASARSYAQNARDFQAKGDDWAADQYFQAAVEQGELALLSKEKSPDQALDLIALAAQLQEIYQQAGKTQEATASRDRVVQYLNAILAGLDNGITDCIKKGTAPGCSEADISGGETVMNNKVKEMNDANDFRMKVSEQAKKLVPEGLAVSDEREPINAWQTGRQKKINQYRKDLNKPIFTPETGKQEADLRRALGEHNKLKEGAQSLQGSGVNIEESEVYLLGDAVVIRGKVSNFKTVPIYQPKITVTGDIYSKVLDLGYDTFKPTTTTTFQIKVEGFTAEAYNHSMSNIPSHQLLLIYKDAQGNEHKLIKPIK